MSTPEADLLKVAATAGLDEIKRAYRKAALAHHPDQNPHPEAARHFRRITEAYRILEAAALQREPRALRVIPLGDRVGYLLGDVGGLVRRWPADRWTRTVDGLPAGVWVASVLEVLAHRWPGSPPPAAVVPTPAGVAEALEAWAARLAAFPLPQKLSRAQARDLAAALNTAEQRLQVLDRAARRRPL
jgi:hypothetical protein